MTDDGGTPGRAGLHDWRDWQLTPAAQLLWQGACGAEGVAPQALGDVAPPMAASLATMRHAIRPLLQRLAPKLGFAGAGVLLHGDEDWQWPGELHLGRSYRVRARVVAHGKSKAGIALRLMAEVINGAGTAVATSTSSFYFLAAGSAVTAADAEVATTATATTTAPAAPPLPLVARWQTHIDQPARYAAASGDDNPVHLDAKLACEAGLLAPPLHGLCTLGFAAHNLPQLLGRKAPSYRLQALRARFRQPVYGGEILQLRGEVFPGQLQEKRADVQDREVIQVRYRIEKADGTVVVHRGLAAFAPQSGAHWV